MNNITFFGEYTFEASPMVVMRGLEIINLPSKQLETLAVLLKANGEIVEKETFLTEVWGEVVVEEHNLTQTIFLLRKALGKLPNGQEYIETVPKRGYRISMAALHPDQIRLPLNKGLLDQTLSAEFTGADTIYVPQLTLGHARDRPARSGISRRFSPNIAGLGVAVLAVIAMLSVNDRANLLKARQLTRDGLRKDVEAPLIVRGEEVLFTELQHLQSVLADVSIHGGTVDRQILPFKTAQATGDDPNRDEILIASPADDQSVERVAAVSLKGGYHILGSLSGHSASWAPDGSHIAFIEGRQLAMADATGQNQRILATLPETPFRLAWSPDGDRIRFSLHESGDRQTIQELEVATGVVRPFLSGDANEHRACCGSWSPDGNYFVYLVGDSVSTSIWVRREPRLAWKGWPRSWEIASGPVDFWRSPVLGEHKEHIYALGEQTRSQLVQLDAARSPVFYGLSISSISYSHNGGWIAYVLTPDQSLWKSRIDGSERVQLTAPGEKARSPQWSPDDSRLSYLSTKKNDAWRAMQIDAQGTSPELLADGGSDLFDLTYSGGGDFVAFDRMPDEGARSAEGISILNTRDKHVEKLPESEGMWFARWSPDGRYLAALKKGRDELMIFDFTQKKWSSAATGMKIDGSTWDRKGEHLFFTAVKGDTYALFSFSPSRHALTEVTVLPERYVGDRSTRFLGVTDKNEVITAFQEGTVEVYDLEVELP